MTFTIALPWLSEWSFWGGVGVGVGLSFCVVLVIFLQAAKA